MSMSVSCAGCGLEYAGARGLAGVFAQPSAIANPRFVRMLVEVKRFHRQARALLATPGNQSDLVTLGQFLAAGRFSEFFVSHFMLPVVSCVWSCGNDLATEYPARYLFQFLDNHGMLSVTGSPSWRTVTGGSQTYVRRAVKQLSAVRTATPVRVVERSESGVTVRTDDDEQQRFDRVVLATHPDQALALLADPTPAEHAAIGAFRYSRAATVLHSDTSLLPAAPRARASWNYLLPSCSGRDGGAVHVTYDMNRLQRLESATRYLVTLNSGDRVDPRTVIDTMTYEHPIYTPASVAAQQRLPELTTSRTAFAGAYHGWGFHEDGCASGVRAAEAFGVSFETTL
jgi:predicted NAD/FAD-binding protein